MTPWVVVQSRQFDPKSLPRAIIPDRLASLVARLEEKSLHQNSVTGKMTPTAASKASGTQLTNAPRRFHGVQRQP
ncbi:hypothetical protein HS088_TW17G00577 [Tripterygium wilfordii]|uniref:Uncharacterized protein n=1 Tax=Tripterygium wilfordii TaxID=458696 RepID=A0A7J7CG72_TRIWF|nr:hypothetical protein HS088_TW17G00577 [Tripterygium wilfordii]